MEFEFVGNLADISYGQVGHIMHRCYGATKNGADFLSNTYFHLEQMTYHDA